jgi:hypothetical protein
MVLGHDHTLESVRLPGPYFQSLIVEQGTLS